MKRAIKFYIATVLIFAMSSCGEQFLEVLPEDNPVLDGFYQNKEQIRTVTATLYGRPWFNFNDKFSWAAGDGLSGDMYQDYQDEGQFFFFTFTPANSIVSNSWASLYSIIARTNVILADMPRIAGGYGVPEADINAGLAEARFFRGMAYYFLAEYWGDVPIVEDPASIIAGGDYKLPRNTYKSVLQYTANDFAFAAEHLPTSDSPGRVTSWSAKGMLAKIKLTQASDLSDPNSSANFAEAAALAKDVIQNSGYALMANYEDLFKPENDNNSESLFALQWISGAWGTGNSRQAVFARSSIITGNSEAWGGGKSMTYDYVRAMDANDGNLDSVILDKRQPWIFMTVGDFYPDMNTDEGGYLYEIVSRDEDGNQLEYKSPVCNNIKKYVVGSQDDIGASVINQASPLNQYMLRLADVYLIFAEATLGAAGSTTNSEALGYFNEIRARAGLNPRTSISFMDILTERRMEFGAEGINWFDVKRFYRRSPSEALDYLNDQERAYRVEAIDGATQADENNPAFYEVVEPDSPVVISAADMELPVPENEVVANPRLSEEPVEWIFE